MDVAMPGDLSVLKLPLVTLVPGCSTLNQFHLLQGCPLCLSVETPS